MRGTPNEMKNLCICSLDAELSSQLQLQPIHFSLIRGVVIAAKVQQPMKNELRYFVIKSQSIFLRLPRRPLSRNNDVAQIQSFGLFKLILRSRKREHVCSSSLPAPTTIEFGHRAVRNKHQRRARVRDRQNFQCLPRKRFPTCGGDWKFALAVDDFDHVLSADYADYTDGKGKSVTQVPYSSMASLKLQSVKSA